MSHSLERGARNPIKGMSRQRTQHTIKPQSVLDFVIAIKHATATIQQTGG